MTKKAAAKPFTRPPNTLERPDDDLPRRCASTAGAANRFLIKARQEMASLNPL